MRIISALLDKLMDFLTPHCDLHGCPMELKYYDGGDLTFGDCANFICPKCEEEKEENDRTKENG